MNSTNGMIAPRRPNSLHRLVANTSLSYGKFRLPFSIMLSSYQTNFTTPQVNNPNLLQFLQNPMNRISIAPSYDWATLNLGHYTPRYSDLSAGNTPLFGAGIDLKPGNFNINAFAGIMQREIEADTNANLPGAYRRMLYTMRLAYNTDGGSVFGLNFIHMNDDTNSVEERPLFALPESGYLTSFDMNLPIFKQLVFYGEVGLNYFTRNQFSDQLEQSVINLPESLNPRYSSSVDIAGKSGFRLDFGNWGTSIEGLYVGDGYRPLGYRFFQSDRVDFTISPFLNLFNNKLTLRGTVGQRFNNLQDSKSQPTNQFIASVNAMYFLNRSFNINADFSNFGVRNNVDNDTLKIEMVSRAFSIMPNYTLDREKATHRFSLMYSQDDFEDLNTITGSLRSNLTQTIMLRYNLRSKEIPISGNLAYNYITNDLEIGMLNMNTVTAGAEYRFLDNTLVPSLRLSFTSSSIGENTPDNRVRLNLGGRYLLTKKLSFRLSANLNNYNYGSQREDVSFNEQFLEFSVNYGF